MSLLSSMEMKKHQRIQSPIQLNRSSHFLKLITKILVPFSVLSVILSYPLLCDFHILAHGLQLIFSFSVGKNYMFLLCNGLLVFIATSSGLIGTCSSVETDNRDFKAGKTLKSKKERIQRELQVESLDNEQKGSIVEAKVTAEVDQEESKMDSFVLVQGREDVPLAVEDEGYQEQRQDQIVSVEQVEDEDEDQVPHGLMSKEELNKKCEEFIRKMKEGIRFEAQQMIMVQ